MRAVLKLLDLLHKEFPTERVSHNVTRNRTHSGELAVSVFAEEKWHTFMLVGDDFDKAPELLVAEMRKIVRNA